MTAAGLRNVALAFILMLPLAAAAMAAEARTEAMTELPGDGPYQRFIVKYRAGSAPGLDPAAVQPRLDRTVAASGLMLSDEDTPLALEWQRRLAVQADVVQAERPLDRTEARRLLEALAADPEVEYVEVDAMMRTGPGPVRRPD